MKLNEIAQIYSSSCAIDDFGIKGYKCNNYNK